MTVGSYTIEVNIYYTVFVRGLTEDGKFQTTTWYTPIKLDSEGFGETGFVASNELSKFLPHFTLMELSLNY
jgi:hypothetical protein